MSDRTLYVDPLGDEFTNEYIAQIPGASECPGKPCADGKERDLWDCGRDWDIIERLQHSRYSLRFEVFAGRGGLRDIKKVFRKHAVLSSL